MTIRKALRIDRQPFLGRFSRAQIASTTRFLFLTFLLAKPNQTVFLSRGNIVLDLPIGQTKPNRVSSVPWQHRVFFVSGDGEGRNFRQKYRLRG